MIDEKKSKRGLRRGQHFPEQIFPSSFALYHAHNVETVRSNIHRKQQKQMQGKVISGRGTGIRYSGPSSGLRITLY